MDKSKIGSSKKHNSLDSNPASPASGSEASWAMESKEGKKESKAKTRFKNLFKRHPENRGASPDASSVVSSAGTEASRYEVRHSFASLSSMQECKL